jgi:hypothetical protein
VQHEARSAARLSRALVSVVVLVPACSLLVDTSGLDEGGPLGGTGVSSPADNDAGDGSNAEPDAKTDAPSPPSCGVLLPGESLALNEELRSCNRRVILIMQKDGNLVLYGSSGRALWDTGTFDTDGNRAVMQTDGDFVVYGRSGKRLFSTQTSAWPGAHLEVRDEGSVVIVSDGVVRWTGRD